MKHANGTEYALCPKVATEGMVVKGCDEHICEQGDPWYGAPELEAGDCEKIYDAMLAVRPPYEPADEVVERCMQAGLAAYDPFKTHSQQVAAIVRATIRAFIGGE